MVISVRRTPARSRPSYRLRLALVALGIAGGAIGTSVAAEGAVAHGPSMGPEGILLEPGKVLAPASGAASGQPVDGISCQSSEQVAYHVHTHLAIFVNGVQRAVPAGIGLVKPEAEQTTLGPFYSASTCYYWLHVHTGDGVIHIESPTNKKYTLGQFFDEWRQPLSATQVGPARGTVTAYVNGRKITGSPRAITLGSRVDVQLDVGKPVVPFRSVDWSRSSL